jgi:uncharacterized phage-associated protein
LKKLGGKSDFHKIFKILYFADQKHLIKYGNPILDDTYVAMKNGPVPSETYDLLKNFRKKTYSKILEPYFNLLSHYVIESKQEPDLDELSESEMICIEEAIQENGKLDYEMLTKKSHDEAWNNTRKNTQIDIIDIAKAGGADEEMIKYTREVLENKRIILK